MRTPLEQSVLQAIQHAGMLAPGDRVGVAVSGGADSVALLRLLERLRDDLGITLAVVHFNHSLRATESEGDAEFVEQLARTRGFEIVTDREDVAAEAQRQGRNLEDMARQLRYAFFERVVHEGRATHIAVAHTADDQAETVLAHVIRGTGLTGLAGIYPVAGQSCGHCWALDARSYGNICGPSGSHGARIQPIAIRDACAPEFASSFCLCWRGIFLRPSRAISRNWRDSHERKSASGKRLWKIAFKRWCAKKTMRCTSP